MIAAAASAGELSLVARGASAALAGWTKFGALLVAPMWATYPVFELRRVLRFAAGFVFATALAFSILMHASWYVPTTLAGGVFIGVRALRGKPVH